MKDWQAYLKTKVNSEIWGAIALDYYHHNKGTHPCESPSNYIDWVIKELYSKDVDVGPFHKVLLSFCVRLLGSDFDRIMKKSLMFVKLAKKWMDPADLECIIADYAIYGMKPEFKKRIQEDTNASAILEQYEQRSDSVIRICHISDLHFGGQHDPLKFTGVDASFNRTDYFINFLRSEKQAGRGIHILIISGDITSTAEDEEYKQFEAFLQAVQEVNVLRTGSFWERIVVVPGNHEVKRGENGTRGDYLKSFQNFITELKNRGRVLCTPYSASGEGACVFSSLSKEKIPFAVYNFAELGVQVLTLVSCFYSQGLDPEVCELIKDYEQLKRQLARYGASAQVSANKVEAYFKRRMYLDTGFFTPDYASRVPFELSQFFEDQRGHEKALRIAVAHHNATKYFEMDKVQETTHAGELLTGLKKLNFAAYMHGHIHCAPGPSNSKPMEVSSASLGGVPSEGTNGFNVISWARLGSSSQAPALTRFELKQKRYHPTSTFPPKSQESL